MLNQLNVASTKPAAAHFDEFRQSVVHKNLSYFGKFLRPEAQGLIVEQTVRDYPRHCPSKRERGGWQMAL
jgi:hypothetical protein